MPIISLSDYDERESDFSIAFGRVLMEWSYVEHSLFLLFQHLTHLPEDMARAIFYSAHSYRGRSDMVSAIIKVSDKVREFPITKDIAEEAIKKANLYVAFRNSLAHNIPIANATENGAEIILIEGARERIYALNSVILIEHIVTAQNNFSALSRTIKILLKLLELKHSERIPEYLEQLRMLPNVPSHKAASRAQEGRQRQRRSARPKAPPSSQNS